MDEGASTSATACSAPLQSGKRTFNDDELVIIKKIFGESMESGIFLPGEKVDDLAKEHMLSIFNKYGSVKIRNKYRELKARFIRNKK